MLGLPVASAPQPRFVSEERHVAKSNSPLNVGTRTEESAPIARVSREPSDESNQRRKGEVRQPVPSALASEVSVVEPAARVEPVVEILAAPKRTAAPPRTTSPAPPKSKTVAPEPKAVARVAPPTVAAQKSTPEAPMPLQRETSPPDAVESGNEPPAVSAAPARALRDVWVTRTIWHPTSDRRHAYVEVSGQAGPLRVREGDLVGRLSVKKIEPWGVVFLDDGIEIQHRVGARN